MNEARMLVMAMNRVGDDANDRFYRWNIRYVSGHPSHTTKDYAEAMWAWMLDDPEWSAAVVALLAEGLL